MFSTGFDVAEFWSLCFDVAEFFEVCLVKSL